MGSCLTFVCVTLCASIVTCSKLLNIYGCEKIAILERNDYLTKTIQTKRKAYFNFKLDRQTLKLHCHFYQKMSLIFII